MGWDGLGCYGPCAPLVFWRAHARERLNRHHRSALAERALVYIEAGEPQQARLRGLLGLTDYHRLLLFLSRPRTAAVNAVAYRS